MRVWICVVSLASVLLVACRTTGTPAERSTTLTTAEVATITEGVRAFASSVARDVTSRGPAAWSTYFADEPTFFMAADGQLMFGDRASAARGIKELEKSIKQIALTWGDGLRVEPLTPTLAMLATPYHEVMIESSGKRIDSTGYFTGLVERGPKGWQFRNAHWSEPGPPAPAR